MAKARHDRVADVLLAHHAAVEQGEAGTVIISTMAIEVSIQRCRLNWASILFGFESHASVSTACPGSVAVGGSLCVRGE